MKIFFNNGADLTIQSYVMDAAGAVEIKTISMPEDDLVAIFSDKFATKRMKIEERGAEIDTLEEFTELEAIVKYTAGIIGVRLTQAGKTPEERIADLAEICAEQEQTLNQAKADMQMAVAEITMLMASLTPASEVAEDTTEEEKTETEGGEADVQS